MSNQYNNNQKIDKVRKERTEEGKEVVVAKGL